VEVADQWVLGDRSAKPGALRDFAVEHGGAVTFQSAAFVTLPVMMGGPESHDVLASALAFCSSLTAEVMAA
jgi:hypothetical protein